MSVTSLSSIEKKAPLQNAEELEARLRHIGATRYHSLIIRRGTLPPEYEVSSWTEHEEIMGVRHRTWPMEGVQFHPESFLTEQGERLLANFLKK